MSHADGRVVGMEPTTTETRENDTEGEECSACGEELEYDRDERMVYCPNDWDHG